MFNNYTVKQLHKLIVSYKKNHNIKNYTKMKKSELVSILSARFVVKNNALSERGNQISTPQINTTSTNISKGLQRYENAVNKIANKSNYQRDSAFGRRIRGN